MSAVSRRAVLLLLGLLSICSCFPQSALAATNVTDDITTDTEWTLAGSPYIINFDNTRFLNHLVPVAAGVTLTIDPGVMVEFADYNGLDVKGTVNAVGTADSPITFTSLSGNVVVSGAASVDTDAFQVPPPWGYLSFTAGSTGTLDNVVISRGEFPVGAFYVAGIFNQGGTVSIGHSSISSASNVDGYGYLQFSGSSTIAHSQIDNHQYGIFVNGGTLAIHNSSIHDNGVAVDNILGTTVAAENNWWGSDQGPGAGDILGDVTVDPWLTTDPFAPAPPDPCAAPGLCASNVMFLPGFEGSRLYRPDGRGGVDKLWEPTSNADVNDLALNPDGTSMHADIYTKVGDILDKLPVSGARIYQSLIDNLDGLKTAGSINDWKPIAYDWRLSLEDLLTNGTERDGKIYYEEATDTPYIEQTLRSLAATSKSGKVTIIAHSNGGLVVKALLNKLGGVGGKASNASKLVDKVILVGSPQSGMPLDVAALLFGTGQEIAIFRGKGLIVDVPTARAFAQNAPAAYHLLPSADYFLSAGYDIDHPIIRFAGSAYQKEADAYTPTILTSAALKGFLTAAEGGRVKPDRLDVKSAEVLNGDLIDYSAREHATVDAWTPPAGIQVDQIAGWGVDTISGINFYTPKFLSNARWYAPIFTEDGDDTVTTPSALMMASSTQVGRYWLNLATYYKDTKIKRGHQDIFEIPQVEQFIANEVQDGTTLTPRYFSDSRPTRLDPLRQLIYVLHSPLTLQVTDSSGNVTGLATDESITQDIPGSTYGQLGEVKYVIVPEGSQYQLTMHGLDTGTFTLDLQESVGDAVATTTTFAEVPVTASTTATLTVSGGVETASALTVDEDGDGTSVIKLDPKVGDTVAYEPPAPVPVSIDIPVPAPQSSGGGGGGVIVRPVQPIATSTAATSTPTARVATTTIVAKPLQKNVQVKAPSAVATLPKKAAAIITQTASVYDASQQSGLQKLGAAVYNGLHGLWTALKRLF